MNENTPHPTFPLPQPLMAPLGVKVTPEMVQEVWDTFVKPTQSDDAPPQSIEMRALMGILRAVYEALEAGPIPAEINPGARTVPVQQIPAEYDGAVLIPADGHEVITTTDRQEFSRLTFTTKQSIWYGPNLAGLPGDLLIQATSPSRLTPGTWKVDDQ